jgi:GDP/UDP-N,N'-diacetylbacillosamine 2-epimerase (hydrolysing)
MKGNRRKICIVTGTRAEYGILYWLIKDIFNDPDLELQIVVTGMHLSPEFGSTWQEIEKDGFAIDYKVEMLLSADTPTSISKSMGLGLIGFADAFTALNPDIIVVLGDRFEVLSATVCALVSGIPTAHIAGGEITEGAIDESIRHSITKMSHLHFTATEEYQQRVIQLGENPENVFNFGGIAVDCIKRTKVLSKTDFEKSIGFKLNKKNLLVTFHPATHESDLCKDQFGELLSALDKLVDTNLIFTKPNADTGGRIIITMIDEYVEKNRERAISFTSMGQVRYLSALKHVDAVVGNSSSGLTEAPTFKIGTINIGDRQKGRIKAKSIIDCLPQKEAILESIKILYSTRFQNILSETENLYGDGGASKKIKWVLKTKSLKGLLKKKFYDLS